MRYRAITFVVSIFLFHQTLAAADIWTARARVGTAIDAVTVMPSLRLARRDTPTVKSPGVDALSESRGEVGSQIVESIETHMRKTFEGPADGNLDSYVEDVTPNRFESIRSEMGANRPPMPRGETVDDPTIFGAPMETHSPVPDAAPTNPIPSDMQPSPYFEAPLPTLDSPPPTFGSEYDDTMGMTIHEPVPDVSTEVSPEYFSDSQQCPSCSGYSSSAVCTCMDHTGIGGSIFASTDNWGSSGGSGWDLGGWLAGGTTINDHGNRTSSGNAPLGFNNYADGPVLNQAWIYAGKEADTGGCGFDWGCRVDFMFGADAPDTQAFGDGGWDDSWDTGGEYGFAMPQYYGELAWNRLTARVGHFYTIIGYEVVQAPDNFFYSHAYTMYYNEPFTHTGVLAQYDWTDNVTLWGGWTAGWDSGFGNRNGGSTFLGGASWSLGDVTFIYATTFGDPGDGAGSDVYMHSLIANYAVTDRLNYVLQSDYQTRETGGARADSYGINQYLFYELTSKLSVGARLEWFDDAAGARIGNGPGDYWGMTLGASYQPHDRWIVRNEARWDWFDGAGAPYDNNTERSQFTLGSSAVYLF